MVLSFGALLRKMQAGLYLAVTLAATLLVPCFVLEVSTAGVVMSSGLFLLVAIRPLKGC